MMINGDWDCVDRRVQFKNSEEEEAAAASLKISLPLRPVILSLSLSLCVEFFLSSSLLLFSLLCCVGSSVMGLLHRHPQR